VSHKNARRSAFALALAEGNWAGGGSTGLTMNALCDYLEKHASVQMMIL
jgi:hypothetical protein